jgi:prevent-host-death family protein
MTQLTVNVRELRDNLATYLTQAGGGDEVIVTSHGKPVAKIVPLADKKPVASLFGAMGGQITIAPDFNDTPQDLIDEMEAAL